MFINRYPVRFPIVAGALVRSPLRRFLARHGIEYTEQKGLLDSQFVTVITSAEQGRTLQTFLKGLNRDAR